MSEEKKSTGFVVKAVSSACHEMWASRQQFGHRIFGPREKAEVFRTRPEARAAIGQMPGAFEHAGFTFRIEAAE